MFYSKIVFESSELLLTLRSQTASQTTPVGRGSSEPASGLGVERSGMCNIHKKAFIRADS